VKRFEALQAELERALSNDKILRLLQQMVQADPIQAIDVLSPYLYQGEPELRLAALELLVEIGQRQTVDIPEMFFAILQDPLSWELRAPILKALLYRLPGKEAAREQLLKFLQSQDWDLVAHIVQALGPLADPELQSWLAECLKHPHYFVRKRAVEALGAQPWSTVVESHLLSMLTDSQSAVVLKVLQTLSNSASYRVMLQLRDLLILPQTPSELKPMLSETADTIQHNLDQLLSKPVAELSASESQALAAWLSQEPELELQAQIEQRLINGLNQIYRFSRPEQVQLIHALLEITPTQAQTLYPAVLRWGLKLQCLELPESTPVEVKLLLEQLLLDQAGPERPPSEQEQAFQLLARYGSSESLAHLGQFLTASPEIFVQLLPLLNRNAEQTLQQLLHLSLRELSPRAIENSLLFLEGFAQTGGLPVALRLFKQVEDAILRKRLTEHLLGFGDLLGPVLLKELERSQDLDLIREGLELLLKIAPFEESLKVYLGFLSHHDSSICERAALGLVRLQSGNEALWNMANNAQLSEDTRGWAMDILLQRGEAILPELLRIAVARLEQPLWLEMVGSILQESQTDLTLLQKPLLAAPLENRKLFLRCLVAHPELESTELLFYLLDDPALSESVQELLELQGERILAPLLNWAQAQPQEEKLVVRLLAGLESELLLQALKDYKHVQARVLLIRALLQKGAPEGQDFLWELLPVSPRTVQLVLFESLAQVSNTQTPWQPILPYIREHDPEIQLAALQVLARTGQSEAAPCVGALLTSADRALRLAAVETLGCLRAHIWTNAIGSQLLEAEQNQDSELREACLLALGRIGGELVLEILLKRLQTSDSPQENLPVVAALGALQHPATVQTLITYFEQVSELEQKQKALQALCQSRQTPALNFVLKHLPDWPLELQRAAIQSLAQTGEAWILPTLEHFLQEAKDWRLQRTVIEVLNYFPRIEALRLLKQFQQEALAWPTVMGWILRDAIQESLASLRARVVSET
jgi:HEAT repeat protein